MRIYRAGFNSLVHARVTFLMTAEGKETEPEALRERNVFVVDAILKL